MKRYRITVDGVEYRIEIEENSAGVYRVKIGDREIAVTAEEITGSEVVAARNSRKWEPAPRARKEAVQDRTGLVQVTSPMPGNVVSVVASEGSKVEPGDPVIILEAMNNYREEVVNVTFPTPDHSFAMSDEVLEEIKEMIK